MQLHDIIVGTAGHIDHGKSTLIRALTGTDPDRLAEEKRRGITIDLGFAHFTQDDTRIGFVDVPGHQRFVKNMLAGAGGIDAVLLVVAANESVMPQTREHLDICGLLGVRNGIVAISKVDLVDSEIRELVELEVQELVKDSYLAGAPIIPVSTVTGAGLEQLSTELKRLAYAVPPRSSSSHLRLPIDRVFSMRGFGTVVTGSLLAGSVQLEQEIEVQPLAKAVRIRCIQVYGQDANRATVSQRVAVNLQNIKVSELARGMELTAAHIFRPVSQIVARVQILQSAPLALKSRTRVRLHYGTGEVRAVIQPLNVAEIAPGCVGYAKLTLDNPIMALLGDRLIIRRVSPIATIGGATVIDIQQPLGKRHIWASPEYLADLDSGEFDRVVLAIANRRGAAGLTETALVSMTNCAPETIPLTLQRLADKQKVIVITDRPLCFVAASVFSDLCNSVLQTVRSFHERDPISSGIPKEELYSTCFRNSPAGDLVIRTLLTRGDLLFDREAFSMPDRADRMSRADEACRRDIERVFRDAGLNVPYISDVLDSASLPKDRAKRIVSLLSRQGSLIKVSEDLVFHASWIDEIKRRLREYKSTSPTIDVAAFKTLLNISRKYAIPLLEYCDRQHITRRVGEQRWIDIE